MRMKLKDKVAIVTGAASGLGKAIATRYAKEAREWSSPTSTRRKPTRSRRKIGGRTRDRRRDGRHERGSGRPRVAEHGRRLRRRRHPA
jgi:NAD(P)-dependent dehydrogenase (short-subunit alcohol dehydrogenase family)